MTEHYQSLILGLTPAGLLTAIKLQLEGLRVALVEDTDHSRGEQLNGCWCADEAHRVAVPHCLELKQLLMGLSLKPLDKELPLWQLLLSDRRLDIMADDIANKDELQRGFPGHEEIISNHIKTLEKQAEEYRKILFQSERKLFPESILDGWRHGFSEKYFKKILANSTRTDDLPAAWDLFEKLFFAINSGMTASTDDHLTWESPLQTAELCGDYYQLPADRGSLLDILLAHFVELGGTFKQAKIQTVNTKGSKIQSVVLGDNQGELLCDTMILGGDNCASAYFSKPSVQKKLARQADMMPVRAGIFSFHYLLKDDVRPQGMGDNCVYIFENAPQELALPALMIELSHPQKSDKKRLGGSGNPQEELLQVTVKGLVDGQFFSSDHDNSKLKQLIFDVLKEIIPFFSDFLIDSTARQGAMRLVPRVGPRPDSIMHPAGMPIITPFANCWRANSLILPGFGLEGAWQCANIVVSRALHYIRR